MPKLSFAGHPLHVQINDVPAALLPTSLVLDLIYGLTGKESHAKAAYYTLLGGYLGGITAGLAGAPDYLEIPARSRVKKVATLHAALNLGLFGITSVNLLLRRGKVRPTGLLPFLLSVLANVGLLASTWYGAQMVYEDGMRVKGQSPIANAPDMELPGGQALEEALVTLEETVSPSAESAD